MRHKWTENTQDKRSKYNKECLKCGLEKIVSPWNVRDISYKKEGKTLMKLPECK